MEPQSRVEIENDVVFGCVDGRELCCDVYRPVARAERLPGLLLLHGGGWRRGSRAAMRGFGLRVGREGFVCVASEYRLAGESPWPAQLDDVQSALRFMHTNADRLGIDPDRIAIQGNSAGAHLALMAAGTQQHPELGPPVGERVAIAAVVAIYPPTLLYTSAERPSGGVPAIALLGQDATPEQARAASPRSHISQAFPPTFLVHGSADQLVPPSASEHMCTDLRRAGVDVEYKVFSALPHGFANVPEYQPLLAKEITSFLSRALYPERRDALFAARRRAYAEATAAAD